MKRRILVGHALCLVVAMSLAASGQTKAPEPAAAVEIAGSLSRFFPAATQVYLEAGALDELLVDLGGADGFYDLMRDTAGGKDATAPVLLPFTREQFRTLARSELAVAGVAGGARGPDLLAIIRTPSADEAQSIRGLLVELMASSPKPTVREQVVRGQKVARVLKAGRPEADSDLAYAVAGRTLVIGAPALVDAVFATHAAEPEAPSLATAPAFADVRSRLGDGVSTLVWADVAGLAGERAPIAELLGLDRSLLRLESIRSLAVASSSSRTEVLLALDRSKENLITLAADAPPVSLELARAVPADMQLFLTGGLDIARLLDFAEGQWKRSSSATGPSWIRDVEVQIGMRFRDELVAALGDEVGMAVDFTPMMEGTLATPPRSSEPRILFLAEVREPIVARLGLSRLLGHATGERAEREYHGVTISTVDGFGCAVLGTTAVAGKVAEVERAIDAHAAGRTLGAADEFAGMLASRSESTVAAAFLSQGLGARVVELMTRSAPVAGPDLERARAELKPYGITVVREPLGLSCTIETGSAAAGAAVIGIGASIAIPSLLAARRAANESSAIGTLRMLSSAEATFNSRKKRYGTMAELVAGKYIDAELGDGVVRNGYLFRQIPTGPRRFEFTAEPSGSLGGDRSFNIVSEDYNIRYTDGPKAPRGRQGTPLGGKP